MGSHIFTPINQLKLTNVAIVRHKKGGKRFEIACYKNKVLEWRNGVETDLDNVVQIQKIFLNVSKGQVANAEDLQKAFGTEDEGKILLEILKKGELQVGDKERSAQLSLLYRDIATTVADRCVNPETRRPYTVTMIESAMADLHFSVNPNRTAKQQALELIKALKEAKTLPIERAQMKVKVVMPPKDAKRIKEKLHAATAEIEDEEMGDDYEMIALIDPGSFKILHELIQAETKGKGMLEVLSVKETNTTDSFD
ncbi:ribosome maturation protein SBDS-like protein [Hyaloraphidium curvatum]|nr:ribosome maturation protein SBDS-like protein [Hyaloraphidium curvatum]